MQRRFDSEKAFEHIEQLASLRRLPGSDGERKAQDYIRKAGGEIGVQMKGEEFSYSTAPLVLFLPIGCLVLSVLILLGSVLYLLENKYTMIVGLVILVGIYVGFKWSGAFETFARRGGLKKSENLVGKIEGKEPKGVVVISAHYDSKSQVMPVMLRAALFILGFLGAIIFGFVFLLTGTISFADKSSIGNTAVFYISLIPSILLFMLVFNFTGNRSPGALDNACGEGIILEAARALIGEPPENFDVLVCSFGCEEAGLCGGINYLLKHEDELKSNKTFMLNFDIPFSPQGRIFLNSGFEFPPIFTSRRLNDMVKDVASQMGTEIKGLYLPVGAAADHMPWVKHGIEATSFLSTASCIHSSRDTLEKVDGEALRMCGEILLGVLRRMDETSSVWCEGNR
ncbi:MAG: M28 family peptidase [Actinomycetota bacterium]|nr:M28 family peptidase [Actinomycetota bacterium]